jgi:hypothetical protein
MAHRCGGPRPGDGEVLILPRWQWGGGVRAVTCGRNILECLNVCPVMDCYRGKWGTPPHARAKIPRTCAQQCQVLLDAVTALQKMTEPGSLL